MHLHQLARAHGDRPALVCGADIVTFSQLPAAVACLAPALDDAAPGERVVLLLKNSVQHALLHLALHASDLVRVPLNWRSTALEVANVVRSARPACVIHDAHTREAAVASGAPALIDASTLDWRIARTRRAADGPRESSRDETALQSINYTSGTLGTPKGAMLTRRNWDCVYRNLSSVRDFRSGDRLGLVGPLSHAAGAYLVPALASGATIVLLPSATPDSLAATIARGDITILQCVPTVLTRLTASGLLRPGDRGALRLVIYGAESMPANTLEASLALLGPILAQNYGLTEAMMTCITLQPHEHHDASGRIRHRTLGRPYPYVEIELRRPDGSPVAAGETGEITIRSPHVMAGYWEQPQATAQALREGWLWSGDLASWNADGFLELEGRAKDLVISGGFNIQPREIEHHLSSRAGVREVAVFGMPDDDWGERLVAAVALDPVGDTAAAAVRDTLRAEARQDLGIRCPKQWLWCTELPRTGNGKIDHKSLRQWAGAEQP